MSLPILFINLERDANRRVRLLAELDKLCMPYQRFAAVWWADVAADQAKRWFSEELNQRQYYKALRDGEKGCYASHIGAWEKLIESNASAMVVLEDDVRLTSDFSSVVNAISKVQEPWDMVKLMGRDREKIRSQRPLLPGISLVDYSRVPSMTAGYVISRSGAAKLLKHRQPFGRPVDVDLRFWWDCDDLRILGVAPAVIYLDDTSLVSSIWHEHEVLTVKQRWRKFKMKMALTIGNAIHRRRLPKL